MTPDTDPVKDAVTEARRTQILNAAIEVFAEKGFHKATIKDVARAAGVADGTIYNYFKNKNDLMVAMVSEMAEISQLFDQINQIASDVTAEELLIFVMRNRIDIVNRNITRAQAIIPQVITNPELRHVFFDTLLTPTISTITQLMQSLMEQGKIRSIPPAVAVQTALSLIAGAIIFQLLTNQAVSNNEEFINQTVDVIVNGFKPKPEV